MESGETQDQMGWGLDVALSERPVGVNEGEPPVLRPCGTLGFSLGLLIGEDWLW